MNARDNLFSYPNQITFTKIIFRKKISQKQDIEKRSQNNNNKEFVDETEIEKKQKLFE